MKTLVPDANILIRAVLGVRVRSLIAKYGAVVEFFAPDTAWAVVPSSGRSIVNPHQPCNHVVGKALQRHCPIFPVTAATNKTNSHPLIDLPPPLDNFRKLFNAP